MKKKSILGLGAMALTTCLCVSCVDDKYDLDNVDMTIGTSVDLWLPESNTAPVELASFMNIGDNDFVSVVRNEEIGKDIFYAHSEGYFDLTIPFVMNGEVDYTVTTPPVEIGKLPDFLDGNDVCMDLYNPIVIADITSTVPNGTLATNFNVKSFKGGDKQKRCDVYGLTFGPGKSATCISKYQEYIPESILDKSFGSLSWLKLTDGNSFSDVLKEIPEQLQFEVTGLKGTGFGAFPQRVDATTRVNLQLYAPLRIGRDFKITYVTDQTGWAEEYGEDIQDVDGLEAVVLHAVIENIAPVDAELVITPIDEKGNVIKDLEPLKVEKVSMDSKGMEINYTLRAKTASGHSLMDFFSGKDGAPVVDGVRVECTIMANQSHIGEYITTDAAVQMKNIRIGVKGNVTYDAN